MLLIVFINYLLPGARTDLTILNLSVWTVILTVAVIAVDGIFAFAIRRLPNKWFDYRKKIYSVTVKERKFYKRIKVDKWKHLVMELGVFTSFSKKKFQNPNDPDYTYRFLLESCYGVIIHIACIFVGFLILPIKPALALRVALPIVLVNAMLNLLPIFILRCNTPKIATIHERNVRKQEGSKENDI